ncbi:MAG: DUF5716 family protein [Lachnospiraceae bacterium]|nr:DUF5716 family protein [Lachnospiraceae bacterium]
MVQAANDLILGIDFHSEHAQLTYYHSAIREPVTMGLVPGKQLLPTALRMDAEGEWHFWEGEPELRQGEEKDRCRLSGIYERVERMEETAVAEGALSAEELLAVYFGQCLKLVKMLRKKNTRLHVMVTVRNLTESWSRLIVASLERNGIERKYIYVQDYMASFYYYSVSQKKELWSQDVALLEYEEEAMTGYVLHIDRSTKPAMASVRQVARQPVGDDMRGDRTDQEWAKEKDRLFFELLKKVFERRNVTVSYLMGDFYQKSWAERSIQFLCYRRHAFQGQNLYSKGACYAAMERAGLVVDRGILFCGGDMVTVNMGMEMRIRGKDTYYPLVTAGVNWYEAHHVCEFIPSGETEIRIISKPMSQGDTVTHLIPLRHLKNRPDRTLRLRMTLYFTAQNRCKIELEDMGFGGLFKSSGLQWERELIF